MHQYLNYLKLRFTTFFILLCIDNSSLPFVSKDDAILGTHLCIGIITKYRLLIHTRTDKKESKTKAVFSYHSNAKEIEILS